MVERPKAALGTCSSDFVIATLHQLVSEVAVNAASSSRCADLVAQAKCRPAGTSSTTIIRDRP
jgi:hypothetical protein